jgi:RNA polymerase sigma-70 factor (ECF subfamily)
MEDLRPLLTVYAYNILGSWEEAKDTVQDVFLKFILLKSDQITDKKSYLIRMVINQAIDHKEKYRKRLADYPGHWLPEPVATENPEVSINRKEILSYSLMVLLERLDSKQRAVFILKEAFDYDHEEIASVLGITTENSRKILSRARKDLQSVSERAKVPVEWVNKYLTAMQSGDVQKVEQLLNEDITVVSDGGGKATAFMNVVRGLKSVSALLSGLYKKAYSSARFKSCLVNHQPALLYYDGDTLVTCQIFSIKNDIVESVFFIRNPDKLAGLQNSF